MSDEAVSPLSAPESSGEPIVMTHDGFERLEAELTRLTTAQRPALLKQVQRAALFTDPKNGADAANAAHFTLDLMDKQIAYLEDVLGRAQVIQSRPGAATVQPGSAVTVRYEDGAEETLTLVGPLEVDPERAGDVGEAHVGRGGRGREQQQPGAGQRQRRRESAADHERPRPSGRRSTTPLASWITNRWLAGSSRKLSLRPEGHETSTTSAAPAWPSPKWSRRSLCE